MSYISAKDKRIYYINSRERTTGDDSDFTYQIDIPPSSGFDTVSVLQISIPKSYYAVQSGEQFTLTEDVKSVNITVTEGNYTRKNFASNIQELLNVNSPNGYTYAITYPNSSQPDNGKYTFGVINNLGIQPSFTFVATNDLFEHMGFNVGTTSFLVDTLESTNVINLNSEDRVFIHSDISNNGHDNILQEIYTSGSPDFSSIIWQNNDVEKYAKDLTTANNNIYRFYLTNEDGIKINLNGQNMEITLLLYKTNPFFDIVTKYIQMTLLKAQ